MLRRIVIQSAAGIVILSAAVFLIRVIPSMRTISDVEIEREILGISPVLAAQYLEIKQHSPEQAAIVQDEARRLLKLYRRGFNVSGGALVSFTRELITPNIRAIHHASEDTLDDALSRVLATDEMFRGDPVCGRFLLSGTSVLSRAKRSEFWARRADDIPYLFDAINEGMTDPQQHAPLSAEAWSNLFTLHISRGHPSSEIDAFRSPYTPGVRRDQIDTDAFCTAFLNVYATLAGARFPGSAAIKSNLVVSSFGIKP